MMTLVFQILYQISIDLVSNENVNYFEDTRVFLFVNERVGLGFGNFGGRLQTAFEGSF